MLVSPANQEDEMPETIDFITETDFMSNAEIEEMEAAMAGKPSDDDWAWFMEATYSDPMEWEDR